MPKKYYTLDDLYQFCKNNNFSHFSAKESGGPIIVQSYGEVEAQGFESDVQSVQGLVPVTLQACHTELNRNLSFISEDTMTKALPSFANKPILGYIHQLDDGTYDFYTHNVSYVEDENSDDGMRIEYEERPIGVVPESCNAHLEYDEEKDKNYVVVTGYIYEDYGNRAVDIIKNNGGKTKVSVEIAVNEMSYNAKEGYLNIDDMYFMGVTCLGKTPEGEVVQEGMEGSNLKLDNFSAKENSMFSADISDKIVDLLSNINEKLDNLSNTKFDEKGVENKMNHFEELLEKYGKTVEDIDFDYENMTDEELDAKFAELFETVVVEGEGQADGDGEGTAVVDNDGDDPNGDPEVEPVVETHEIKYELSHDDVRYALYNLIAAKSEDDYYYTWIAEVYDSKFIYEDYRENKYYRQKYTKDGDNIALDGDPIEVFSEWLSKEEKDALDALKSDYAALKEFKDTYDVEQTKAEKTSILESAEYAEIKDSDEFKALVSEMDKYSVEEIKVKADLLFAASMKKKFNFNTKLEKKSSVSLNFNAKPDDKQEAYAGLFKK
jgi:hypothetical protein